MKIPPRSVNQAETEHRRKKEWLKIGGDSGYEAFLGESYIVTIYGPHCAVEGAYEVQIHEIWEKGVAKSWPRFYFNLDYARAEVEAWLERWEASEEHTK